MAPTKKENTAEGHAGQEAPIEGEILMTPPPSTDVIQSHVIVAKNAVTQAQVREIERESAQGVPTVVGEDQVETPKSENPPSIHVSTKLKPSEAVHRKTQSQSLRPGEVDHPGVKGVDYFASRAQQVSHVASSSKLSPTLGGSSLATSRHDYSSNPVSPEKRAKDWTDISTQTVIGPDFNPGSTRPTSVPNLQSASLSQRREASGYPNYPDQSFKALQSQEYYQPFQPHPLRTRSSHPSQNLSYSWVNSKDVKDFPHANSGSKTVGNTPAQSPALFSPMFPTKRQPAAESDDGHYSTPLLHPTHLQAPKETHKLQKDIDPITGRKTINHYELFEKLGSGQHGTVKLGKNLDTGERIAVKIVRRFSKKLRLGKSGDPNDMIKKEVAILKKARHPHVVSLIEVIDDADIGKVYLILEFVERGEIVWRKQTDKDIAFFEMERTKRELANPVNDDDERMLIEDFNSGAASRRLEKAHLLEEQKRKAKEVFEAGRPQRQARRYSSDPYFSLEYVGESETETENENENEVGTLNHVEAQHYDNTAPENTTDDSPQTATPMHTPKPRPHPVNPHHLPTTEPTSRPDTPASLEGSMYGACLEETSSDVALQNTLDEIISKQTKWAPEEEDFRYVPCLTLSQALDAFRDTVLGLEYLHYQGIIHRDIKPANLLWTSDYRVKISDFGVSYLGKPIREDDNKEEIPEADAAILDEAIELAKTVGTPAFYAPELCDPQFFEVGKHHERPAITGQIDVWALGVTLYGIIFGRLPFFDTNEFRMYEKIAREEVFIPRLRLRGVEHTDKTPSNNHKRLDDVLEYEEVDDELRDLLKRLLDKKPSKRITLKEVKHHPWVLQGIKDHSSWIDETDPSLQSQGRKIEVSTQEVQDAVVGLNLVDRFKAGIQRATSMLRGRGSRKRTDSNPKAPSVSKTAAAESGTKDERRTSLRGDEQIFTALRASREGSEHPLAQSVAASPELKDDRSYFDDGTTVRPASADDDTSQRRPTLPDRTLSAADSMKTIRAPVTAIRRDLASSPNTSSPSGDFSSLTAVVDTIPSPQPNITGVFAGAGRRLANTMRSRERGASRQSPSHSSRSSSVDATDDCHASPSLAVSSAIAAGHVDQPPALREEVGSPRRPNESSAEAFQRAQEQNFRRQTREYSQRVSRRPIVSTGDDLSCPPSPDDEIFRARRPASAAESNSGVVISSSSDQIVSGESTAHSRIPSVVSGASSLSATVEEANDPQASPLTKTASPQTVGRRSGSQSREPASEHGFSSATALATDAAEDEAGYNGEAEQDSDSEDEGLAMA